MKKEKNIKTYQRRTKTGKVVTVKAHTAKYDAAEELKKAAAKALGAGGELMSKKAKKQEVSPYDEFGFTEDEFSEWYEGTGSKADKKVEKALRKILGRKAYTELNDKAADSYKAGGAHKFFTKESKSFSSADSPSSAYKEAKKRYVDNMPKSMTVEEAIKYHKKNAPRKNEFGDRIGVTKSDEAKLRQYLSGERDFPKASDMLKSLRSAIVEPRSPQVHTGSVKPKPQYSVNYVGSDGKTHTEYFDSKDAADDFRMNSAAAGSPAPREFRPVKAVQTNPITLPKYKGNISDLKVMRVEGKAIITDSSGRPYADFLSVGDARKALEKFKKKFK